MGLMNRLGNAHNSHQGKFKKVLCVCSAGILRSPSAALVLSQEPFNFNTRAAGLIDDYALIIVDQVLLEWADEIVCMEASQKSAIQLELKHFGIERPVHNLNIPDNYNYRDPKLLDLIKKSATEVFVNGHTFANDKFSGDIQPREQR